jgi:hypothetical protein
MLVNTIISKSLLHDEQGKAEEKKSGMQEGKRILKWIWLRGRDP